MPTMDTTFSEALETDIDFDNSNKANVNHMN